VGWDGLGLVSFLLVIYFNDFSTLNSGVVTIMTNRIGDSFFIIGFMFFFYYGWLSLDSFRSCNTFFFSFFLVLGIFTKRAQFPFSSWLPLAIAAPTPVSSLVHSSTLVTAGVYTIVRFNYIFINILVFVSFFSLLTLFLAGICAVIEKDFKKVVAMSTLSQLGFILFSLSLGFTNFSFIHILFHAFFKSSLFISTGGLMHYISGAQDYRLFGSMGSSFFSKIVYCVSCLSLMGFPFSLGFYSKDLILCSYFSSYFSFFFLLFFFGCSFSVAYSFRLIYMGFFFYPSFLSSLNFKEDKIFVFSVLMLYFYCVFIGNFYFFFFSFPFVFSFL